MYASLDTPWNFVMFESLLTKEKSKSGKQRESEAQKILGKQEGRSEKRLKSEQDAIEEPLQNLWIK